MSLNENLKKAKRQKNDEFYTQLPDIENELRHYTGHFPGKVVYCNCDDPRVSNFFHYFSYNFERLGLKKLITACYRNQDSDLFSRHDSERAIWLEYKGNAKGGRVPDVADIGIREFAGDGDFRSAECIELLKQADIVVTNPPFSLFREYVAQLVQYGKKFLIVGSQNAVTYKEIFPLIKDNRMWLGVSPKGQDMLFDVPEVRWSYFLGQAGGGVKVYSGVMDHAARVPFNPHPLPVLYSISFGTGGTRRRWGFEAVGRGRPGRGVDHVLIVPAGVIRSFKGEFFLFVFSYLWAASSRTNPTRPSFKAARVRAAVSAGTRCAGNHTA